MLANLPRKTGIQDKVEKLLTYDKSYIKYSAAEGLICAKIVLEKKISDREIDKYFSRQGKFLIENIYPKKAYKKLLICTKDKKFLEKRLYNDELEIGLENSTLSFIQSMLPDSETQEIVDFLFIMIQKMMK